MIEGANKEQLEKLISNHNAMNLLVRAKVKKQLRVQSCEVSEVVTFWKSGESWIDEKQIMQAAKFLESLGLIRYVATEFSLIIEV